MRTGEAPASRIARAAGAAGAAPAAAVPGTSHGHVTSGAHDGRRVNGIPVAMPILVYYVSQSTTGCSLPRECPIVIEWTKGVSSNTERTHLKAIL